MEEQNKLFEEAENDEDLRMMQNSYDLNDQNLLDIFSKLQRDIRKR